MEAALEAACPSFGPLEVEIEPRRVPGFFFRVCRPLVLSRQKTGDSFVSSVGAESGFCFPSPFSNPALLEFSATHISQIFFPLLAIC